MWKKFKAWFRNLFSARFIVPVVNEKLATAVDDKLKARRKKYDKMVTENQQILRNYARTYLDKAYSCEADMAFAFDEINRAWKKHVRSINSTSKIISLRKDGFEIEVKALIKIMKAKKSEMDKKKEAVNG
jgi:hypothetical protein